MENKFIQTKIDENNIAHLTLNRPEIHNAFNDEMIHELINTFTLWDSPSHQVKAVLLKGNGPSFCAGADLNWMKKMKNYTTEENFKDSLELAKVFKVINTFSKPVIAAVHGNVLGGGIGLIASCDYVIATADTKMGLSEVRLGLLPAVISPFVIAKMGESWARATFLSGHRFDATEAKNMNLVHYVAEDEKDWTNQINKVLSWYNKVGPNACVKIKWLIQEVLKLSSAKGLRDDYLTKLTCETIAKTRTEEEAQEGMQALLEKRPAQWIQQ